MPRAHQSVPFPHGFSRHVAASALAVGLCTSMAAQAADPNNGGESSMSWSLGIGASSKQAPYTGIDRENQALPLLRFENRYVEVFGPRIGVKLPGLQISETQKLNFSLVGKYDGSGYEADDAPILNGMKKRRGGFWAGAKAEWDTGLFELGAEWLGDASGNSKGQRFSLGLEKTWRFGHQFMLTPRLGAHWHDKKYVDYYYGVRDSEVRADRPAYQGKSGVNAELGVRGIYMFDQRHSLMMDVEVTRLASSIKDSPLVDRSTENRVFLGYLYRFR